MTGPSLSDLGETINRLAHRHAREVETAGNFVGPNDTELANALRGAAAALRAYGAKRLERPGEIPGPLPYREDGYVTHDPFPWERFDGTRVSHTGRNLYGSGYVFKPRPRFDSQWYAWWMGVQATIERWAHPGSPMVNPYPMPADVEPIEVDPPVDSPS